MDAHDAATFVLRHCCGGVEISGATQLIGDFAFEPFPTWDTVFSSNHVERRVLYDVVWLCSRGIFDSWIKCFLPCCSEGEIEHPSYTYMDIAAQRGFLSVVRFLHEHGKRGFTRKGIEGAAANGHLKVLKFLMERRGHPDKHTAIGTSGHLEIVQYLYEAGHSLERTAPKVSAHRGNLPVIEYLWVQDQARAEAHCEWSSDVANAAAQHNQTHVVKWLYENTPLRCTVSAFPAAARHGNLQLIQYLLDHCDDSIEPATIQDMTDNAADGNHHELMEFLETLGGDVMTSWAMDGAAKHGNLEFVKYLHAHNTQALFPMEEAAVNGHFDVVHFMHYHQRHGCVTAYTTYATECAVMNGHLDVVKFLLDTVGVDFEDQFTSIALEWNQVKMVEYFHSLGVIDCKRSHAKTCIESGSSDLLKLLCDTGRTRIKYKDLELPSLYGQDEILSDVVNCLLGQEGGGNDDQFEAEMATVMTRLVERGKLHQILLLESKFDTSRVDCTDAVNAAAVDGRLDVLQHFHSRGYRGFSDRTMEHAVAFDNTSCAKFLHEHCGFQYPPKPDESGDVVQVTT